MDGIEKREMELKVIEVFLKCYNRQFELDYEVSAKPDKPDYFILSKRENKRMGVEITLAFYQDKNGLSAKKMFNRSDTIIPLSKVSILSYPEYHDMAGDPHSSGEMVSIINNRIKIKTEKAKNYNLDYPVILVIGIGDPLFERDSLNGFEIDKDFDPANQPFFEIWTCIFDVSDDENCIMRII